MSEEHQQPVLRRALGLWSAIAIIIGTVIGSGIFLVPTDMVKAVGSPGMVFVVFIFGGILTLFGALTYAELSAAMPEAGGEYVYLTAAYGPLFGFIYGWTQTWVAKSASIASLATAFFTYLADFFPSLQSVIFTIDLPIGPHGGPLEIRSGQLLGIAVILCLATVNYLGVRLGARVQVTVTALKVALIAGIIVAGLLSSKGTITNFHRGMTPEPGGVAGFFVALVAALWAYDGWNNAGMLGSEIEKPGKNFPRALILGTLCVMGIYLLTNLTYFYILSGPEVGASTRLAADVMRRVFGNSGGALVSVAAMISIFAALNGSLLSGSRVPYAMARDGLFFHTAGRVHPTFRTPAGAIVILGGWSALLLLTGQYQQLYTLVIFPSWILYGMTAASVIVLRRKRPEMERPYRVMGYPLVPILFVAVSCALIYSTLMSSPRESGIGLAVILIGFPFYFHWRKKSLLQVAVSDGVAKRVPGPFQD